MQCQISAAADLVSKLCQDERHQQALSDSGVLDALATRLASFAVAAGLVLPGADICAQREGLYEYIPPPAALTANLTVILEAIAVIINDSKYRATQLLYSPSILAVFPPIPASESVPPSNHRAAWNAFNLAGLSGRQDQLNALEYLIPYIPFYQLKASAVVQNSAFPPLGTSASREHLPLNGHSGSSKYNGATLPSWIDSPVPEEKVVNAERPCIEAEEPESPLIAFLILLLRSRADLERLVAAHVLTIMYRTGLTNKSRESAMGLLLVPLLANMLDDGYVPRDRLGCLDLKAQAKEWAIKEKAPAILSILVKDNEYLHKAAFDAGLASKLSKMIKVAYNPVLETPQLSWSPTAQENDGDITQSSVLGPYGQPPLLAHKIKVRESTLKAIAALVVFKDEYRKAIVDQGAIPYIIESMRANPRKPSPKVGERNDKSDSNQEPGSDGYGQNPVSVLIAGCGAVRALSRSVSILRTTLIDNGVAMPVFDLLQHPDVEVQVAACASVCNLVTDVSPMREVRFSKILNVSVTNSNQSVADAGVVEVLCEQAHSMNTKLRINALWALKHFICGVSNEQKKYCLEELGQGWLVRLICDDQEDESLPSKNGTLSSPSYDADEDIEMDHFEDSLETTNGTESNASNNSRPGSSRSRCIQEAEARLATLRDVELNTARKARQDHIAVQEQALEFMRNLITGASPSGTSETTEMIDFLFSNLGQDRVFDILAQKLRPKLINPFKRNTPGTETKIVPPQPEIIVAATFILVNMAASVPRHRQLVTAQTELLKLLVPQFTHPNVEVRTALCYLVTNLTWMDDTHDAPACAQRANELKKLGFLTKIEMLEDLDPELNIRQRAKCAIWQMKQPS